VTKSTRHALFTSSEIRAIEVAHAKKFPKVSLMQRAGDAVAKLALKLALTGKRKVAAILVLAGPGNNGGDAWVAAMALQKSGQRVIVIALGDHKFSEPAAKRAHAAFVRAKGVVRKDIPKEESFDLIIDGLFGIGLVRAPAGAFANVIARANALRTSGGKPGGTPILAIDIPSGLSADTGVALGEAIHADHTITFLGFKPGLFTGEGKDHAGDVHLEMLGVAAPGDSSGSGELLTAESVRELIPARRHHSHKGTYGNVGIIGGAEGMVGAAVLAARAALYMGPGKVFAGIIAKDVPAYDLLNPEIMFRKADDLAMADEITVLAIGMGMGVDKSAPRLLSAALGRELPMVLDADALNLISATPSFGATLSTLSAKSSTGAPSGPQMPEMPRQCWSFVLTPHPGEAARLMNVTVAHLQGDRVTSAIALAKRFKGIVVLKGAGTVIAAPDDRYFINTSGNPGMASGGMGDALSGMIAAFLGQGLNTLDAARLAVYLHGAAADACIAHGMAPLGLTASEVIFEARALLNAGLEHHDH
jgi:hydroxyethylthiazole kinase-like uncharacterized protein yjeF